MSPLLDETAKLHFRDLIDGLMYLHSSGVAHRDIKPENLLVFENGTLRIADFGSAATFDAKAAEEYDKLKGGGENHTATVPSDVMRRDTVGTTAFQAPEVLAGETFDLRSVDVWAAGATLWCFTMGSLPFPKPGGMSQHEWTESIQHQELVFPSDEEADSGTRNPFVQDILLQLLEKDPKKRISLEQAAAHDYISDVPPPELPSEGDVPRCLCVVQ